MAGGHDHIGAGSRDFTTGTWLITYSAAATHLGFARRALDEARKRLVHSSSASTGLGGPSNSAAVRTLERAEGIVLSCRLALYATADALWSARAMLPARPVKEICTASLVGVSTVHQCSKAVRMAYSQGGAAAIARSHPLQKCLRDSSCLVHHVAANASFLEAFGRVRLGPDGLAYQLGRGSCLKGRGCGRWGRIMASEQEQTRPVQGSSFTGATAAERPVEIVFTWQDSNGDAQRRPIDAPPAREAFPACSPRVIEHRLSPNP